VWVNGVWTSGWQALYGVVPPERRDGVRVFMEGVPWQAGVVLSGAVLLLADRLLGPSYVFVVGGVAGVLATYTAWRARRAYAGALVDALNAGWPDVFVAEEEPFGGIHRDTAAVDALVGGLADPDPVPRRMAVEIVATMGGVTKPEREAVGALLADPDPQIRAAAAGAVARWGEITGPERAKLRKLFSDSEPAVRAAAAAALAAPSPDPEAAPPPDPEAGRLLRSMATSPDPSERATAVVALGHARAAFDAVAASANDEDPFVREAAVGALARFQPDGSVELLSAALGDPDPAVRSASAAALARLGAPGTHALLDALSEPSLEDAALRALAELRGADREGVLAFARREAGRAIRYHELWKALGASPEDTIRLLADSVRNRALGEARRALTATVAVTHDDTLRMAVEYVESHHPEQRANAVETIEAVADPEIARPLLPIWEPMSGPADAGRAVLELMDDDDPWVRACAALAAPAVGPETRAILERLASSDPDELVRQTAGRALRGDPVETLATLPLMERVMFLRSVPLFADLAPEDLKHIAEAATEHIYQDGTVIGQQGELGEELYLVISGAIRVLIDRGGTPIELAQRKSGEYVGEMGIVSGEPRMASLLASGDVRVLTIDRTRFERILVERPSVAMAVMAELSNRLRRAYQTDPVESKI
jgi:HEAT repeat protein